MYGVDLGWVGIVKNNPTATWGPGEAVSPPGPWHPSLASWVDSFEAKCLQYNPLSTVKELASYLVKHGSHIQKTKFSPKSTKMQKNTKIVRMTSYSQVWLSKKSAAQKYQVLIFRTNEGDFSGTPVKNQ